MGYFFRKLEKAANLTDSLLKSKRRFHTLILLGDDGKVKHIRILRGVITAVILVQIVVLFSGAYFFSSGTRFVEDMKAIENELAVLQKNYLTIRDEKDMLMARLVLAESTINKETGVDRSQKPAEKSADESAANVTITAADEVRIYADNISIFHETGSNRLKIKFDLKIKNSSKQVSGYCFVILKDSEIDEAGWLAVPSVPLVSKKPAAANKGRYFSASKNASVNLMATIKSLPLKFKSATIYAYSVSGELLLEKSFPVFIK